MGKTDDWWLDQIWRLTDYSEAKSALRVLQQFKREAIKAAFSKADLESCLKAVSVVDAYAAGECLESEVVKVGDEIADASNLGSDYLIDRLNAALRLVDDEE